MENIFTYNPNAEELIELTGFPKTDELQYLKDRKNDFVILDLALLFEMRNNKKKAVTYWQQIKELREQYNLGFDYKIILK